MNSESLLKRRHSSQPVRANETPSIHSGGGVPPCVATAVLLVIVTVNSEFLKRWSTAERTTGAYSPARWQVRGVVAEQWQWRTEEGGRVGESPGGHSAGSDKIGFKKMYIKTPREWWIKSEKVEKMERNIAQEGIEGKSSRLKYLCCLV